MTNDVDDSGREVARVMAARDLELKKLEIECKRSAVRRRVTYGVISAYLFLAVVVAGWLMWKEKYDLVIGVLGGVAALAGSISGFWFGSRRPGYSRPEGG